LTTEKLYAKRSVFTAEASVFMDGHACLVELVALQRDSSRTIDKGLVRLKRLVLTVFRPCDEADCLRKGCFLEPILPVNQAK